MSAQTFDLRIAGTSRAGWFVDPSLARGEARRVIQITEPQTGMRVNMTSPEPTNEFIVAVDGGAFGSTPQVSNFTGNAMTSATLTLSVPPGSGYRVRAVAVNPSGGSGTFPIMLASGKAEGVSVISDVLTEVSVGVERMSVAISAPDSVTGGETIEITWTYADPGAALDRTPSGLDGRVRHSSSSASDLTGTQVHAQGIRLSDTEFQFTASFTAPTTAGELPFQVSAQTFDLRIAGTSRAGWFVDPSLARGEARRTILIR